MKKQKQLIPWGAIVSACRRLWLWSDQRRQAMNNAKISRGKYRCAVCQKAFKRAELQVDHLIPCGSVKGAGGVEAWLTRLFCGADGLQVLCKEDHLAKTNSERS